MRQHHRYLTLLSLLGSVIATTAWADNPDVEDALRRRDDLSSFYQAMINTGVNRELKPGMTYSIFAPTNEALARIRQDQYPCFYMSECRGQVADIIRNHIVPGEVYVSSPTMQHGGVYSLDNRFITLGESTRNNFMVDGKPILYSSWFGSGILYKIDGVIANHIELSGLEYPRYPYAYAPEKVYLPDRQVTTTERTLVTPNCGPGGCVDEVTRTTTVTETVPTPGMGGPLLSPAR